MYSKNQIKSKPAEGASPLVDVEGLNISLLDPSTAEYVPVVKNVDFQVPQGAAVGLTGISGGGKSTLVRALSGVLPESARVSARRWVQFGHSVFPLAGTVLQGYRLNQRIRKLARNQLFSISQDARSALVPFRNIRWHLNQALRSSLHQTVSDEDHVSLLARIGFNNPRAVLDRYPAQLAGGECQRIQFAIARNLDVELLVADEPFSFVDAEMADEFAILLRDKFLTNQTSEGHKGIVFVSHNLSLMRKLTSFTYVMCQGRIAEEGESDAVLTSSSASHPHTRLLLQMADPSLRIVSYRSRPQLPQIQCVFSSACIEGTEDCVVKVPEFQPRKASQHYRCLKEPDPSETAPIIESATDPETRPTSSSTVIRAERVQTIYAPVDQQKRVRHPRVIHRDFQIFSGERLGLSGPSGCGKTTFARMLLGLQPLLGGIIERFQDESLKEPLDRCQKKRLWQRVGWVSQDSDVSLDPQSTVGELLRQAYQASGQTATAAVTREQSARLISRFRLDERFLNARSAQLSGGERRRVSIARTLAAFGFEQPQRQPHLDRLLVLDEPTVGIDAFLQTFLSEVLLDAQRQLGLTYLIISHDERYLESLCHRIEDWKSTSIE